MGRGVTFKAGLRAVRLAWGIGIRTTIVLSICIGSKAKAAEIYSATDYKTKLIRLSLIIDREDDESARLLGDLQRMQRGDLKVDSAPERVLLVTDFSRFIRHPHPIIRCLSIDAEGKLLAVGSRGGLKPPDVIIDELRDLVLANPRTFVAEDLARIDLLESNFTCSIESIRKQTQAIARTDLLAPLADESLRNLNSFLDQMLEHASEQKTKFEVARRATLDLALGVQMAAELALQKMGRKPRLGQLVRPIAPAELISVSELMNNLWSSDSARRQIASQRLLDYAFDPELLGRSDDWEMYESILVELLKNPSLENALVKRNIVEAFWQYIRPGNSFVPQWLKHSDRIKAQIARLLFDEDPEVVSRASLILTRAIQPQVQQKGVNGSEFESVFIAGLESNDLAIQNYLLDRLHAIVPRPANAPGWLAFSLPIQLRLLDCLNSTSKEIRKKTMRLLGVKLRAQWNTTAEFEAALAKILSDHHSSEEAIVTVFYLLEEWPTRSRYGAAIESALSNAVAARPNFREVGLALFGRRGVSEPQNAAQIFGTLENSEDRNLRLHALRSLLVSIDTFRRAEPQVVRDFLNPIAGSDNGFGTAGRLALTEFDGTGTVASGAALRRVDQLIQGQPTRLAEAAFLEMCRRR